MRRYPVASLIAILSLAVGLGATTVSLTIRDVIFHRPPATISSPSSCRRSRLARRRTRYAERESGSCCALRPVADIDGPSIAAHLSLGERRSVSDRHRKPCRLHAVTPELFATLGVAPTRRPPSPDGDESAASERDSEPPHVAAALRPAPRTSIGQAVWIDDRAYTVIGVMPEAFWLADMDSPIWTVLTLSDMPPASCRRVAGRHRAAVRHVATSPRAASAACAGRYAQHLPAGERQLALRASGLEGTPMGQQMSFVLPYVLGTAVLLTLLIACANVAILMIAQWTAREHEIAIRASIGASRGRIVRLLLTESILIAACGGALGIGATALLQAWIIRQSGDGTSLDLSDRLPHLLETAAIALVAGIVAGLAPALYETRRLHANPLRTIATPIAFDSAGATRSSSLKSGHDCAARRHGDDGRRLSARATCRRWVCDSHCWRPGRQPEGRADHRVLEILRGVPGVAAAAATSGSRQEPSAAPAGGESVAAGARRSRPTLPGTRRADAGRTRVFGGRLELRRRDRQRDACPAAVSGRDAVGARLWVAKAPYDIVGVVADYAAIPDRPTSQSREFSCRWLWMPGTSRD